MATEFVVTSPAASGLAAFKAHYATVEAALRVANMVIDEGASSVWIVDGAGNTILHRDEIRILNRVIAQNNEARGYLLSKLQNFQTAVDHSDVNDPHRQYFDSNPHSAPQLKLWIAKIDRLFPDLDDHPGEVFVKSSGNGHAG